MATATVRYVANPIESVTLELSGAEAQALSNLVSHVRLGQTDVGDHFYAIGGALRTAGIDFELVDVVLTENGIELVG